MFEKLLCDKTGQAAQFIDPLYSLSVIRGFENFFVSDCLPATLASLARLDPLAVLLGALSVLCACGQFTLSMLFGLAKPRPHKRPPQADTGISEANANSEFLIPN